MDYGVGPGAAGRRKLKYDTAIARSTAEPRRAIKIPGLVKNQSGPRIPSTEEIRKSVENCFRPSRAQPTRRGKSEDRAYTRPAAAIDASAIRPALGSEPSLPD